MTEQSSALVVRQNDNFLAPVADLQTILDAYQLKKSFIEKVLHKDLDFGTIPGSEKPALYKPGAEKLANIYGFAPVFDDIQTIEDWSGADHNDEPFFYYRQKCKLYKGDRLVGSADGSCNSWEKKYRYRTGQRLCPDCQQPTIFKSKPPKTGFYCWSKKGGCGAQFPPNDKRITEQELGQVKNPDICDATNTILKMAQKRALVAAILITTGASDYFTQDLDDFVPADVIDVEYTDYPTTTANGNGKPGATKPESAVPKMSRETAENITNSEGIRYGDLDSSKLEAMPLGIRKGLEKKGITVEQRETYLMKLDAIEVILTAREREDEEARAAMNE